MQRPASPFVISNAVRHVAEHWYPILWVGPADSVVPSEWSRARRRPPRSSGYGPPVTWWRWICRLWELGGAVTVRRACCRPCRVGSQLTTAKTFQEPGRSLSSWLLRLSSRMGASATRSWMVRETLCDAREGPIRGLPRYQGSRNPRCAAADPAVRGRRRAPGQAGAAVTDALDRLQPVPTTLGRSTSSSTSSSAKVASCLSTPGGSKAEAGW
jgi:hypothetical protein